MSAQFIIQKFEAPPATVEGSTIVHLAELDRPDEDYGFSSWQAVVEEGRTFIVVLWERTLGLPEAR